MPEPYVYANMSNEEVLAHLTTLGACDEATAWVRSHGGDLNTLLTECSDGDWLVWYARRVLCVRALRMYACDCAGNVLHVYEALCPNDSRPRNAIAVARRFANGDATREELAAAEAASAAASAAAYAAARYAAAYAASSAAYAAAYAADAAAERAWQRDLVVRYIRVEVPDA